MFKVLALLKRRAGLSVQEFVDYYESAHSKIGDKYLSGRAEKYIRRYLNPIPNPLSGMMVESAYDVVMEMWFKDRDQFRSTMALLAEPELAKTIAEDEKRLFDRASTQIFTVEEYESELNDPR